MSSQSSLDFAVSIWPGGRSERLERALAKALTAEGYPDERNAILAVARRHDRSPDEVLLLNGASEAFWLLAHTFRRRSGICIHPSFTEAEAAMTAVGAEVVRVLRLPEEWRLDPSAVPNNGDVVFVCNPNNPTGTLDPAEAVASLTRPGRLLVVDESFMDFVPEEKDSLAGMRDIPGLVVVRSLTKVWGLAGVRAGYLLASPDVVAALSANRQPWSVNSLACAALEACAEDLQTSQKVASEVASARKGLIDRLQGAGIHLWPSAANFLLLELPQGPKIVDALTEEGIVVRPAESFPGLGPNHIRVAVRRPEENNVLAEALIRVITRLSNRAERARR